MDDLRAILRAFKDGWRWLDGGLWYCDAWKIEDQLAGKSNSRITGEALLGSMNDIMDFLEFTLELHEDFVDQKLPTLNTKFFIVGGNMIHYEFIQKPMSSNLVLKADSALSDSVKVASLKEEVVRRLKNTSQTLDFSKRMETLEDFSQKMINSGHKNHFIKNILIRGILRYEDKLRNSKLEKGDPKYKPLHQPSG